MKSPEKVFNNAFIGLFAAITVVATIGAAFFNASHQWFMAGISVVMALTLVSETKKLRKQ